MFSTYEKIPILGDQNIEIHGFSRDLCCKMAKPDEFGKTWVFGILLPNIWYRGIPI